MKAKHLLLASLLAVSNPGFGAEYYDVIDLGPIYPLNDEESQDLKVHMNDNNVVVGWSRVSRGDPNIKGFVWDEISGRQYLTTTLTFQDAAIAVNNGGIVVGWHLVGGARHPCYWIQNVDLTWSRYDFYVTGSTSAEAHTIDEAGNIGVNWLDATSVEHGYIYNQPTGLPDNILNPLLLNSHISQISNTPDIIGEFTNGLGETHAFVMDIAGTPVRTDLGFLGTQSTNYSHVHTINPSGIAVGGAETDPEFCDASTPPQCWGIRKAVKWDVTNGLQELIPTDVSTSWANGINPAGDIVGWRVENNQSSALLWQAGSVLDLNKLINPATVEQWDLKRADAINASGRIVGTGIMNDENRAYMLVPSGIPVAAVDLAIAVVTPVVAAKLSHRGTHRKPFDPIQIQVSNQGPNVASDVVVYGTVPYDITLEHVSIDKNKGSCLQKEELQLTCNIKEVAVGETVTIDVNLDMALPTNYQLTFFVQSTDSSLIEAGGVPNNSTSIMLTLPESYGEGAGGAGSGIYPEDSASIGFGGCSLSTGSRAIDPLFYLMLLASAFYLYRRRSR